MSNSNTTKSYTYDHLTDLTGKARRAILDQDPAASRAYYTERARRTGRTKAKAPGRVVSALRAVGRFFKRAAKAVVAVAVRVVRAPAVIVVTVAREVADFGVWAFYDAKDIAVTTILLALRLLSRVVATVFGITSMVVAQTLRTVFRLARFVIGTFAAVVDSLITDTVFN